MARHHERHGVVGKRGSNGPNSLRTTDFRGNPAVGTDLAAGDLEGLEPDRDLELGVPAKVERNPHAPIAGETGFDGPRQVLGDTLDSMEGTPHTVFEPLGQQIRVVRAIDP